MSEVIKRKGGPNANEDSRGYKRSKVCTGLPFDVILYFPILYLMLDAGCCASRVSERAAQYDCVLGLTCKIQGGSGGKWQTPHQKGKSAQRGGEKIEPGDVGIWATCVKGREGAATQELKSMFDEVCITLPKLWIHCACPGTYNRIVCRRVLWHCF